MQMVLEITGYCFIDVLALLTGKYGEFCGMTEDVFGDVRRINEMRSGVCFPDSFLYLGKEAVDIFLLVCIIHFSITRKPVVLSAFPSHIHYNRAGDYIQTRARLSSLFLLLRKPDNMVLLSRGCDSR